MKKILITAVYYPPCELVGAKRPFKMANFLSESGWDVTVLTVDPTLTPPASCVDADRNNIEIIRTKAFVPYVALRSRLKNGEVVSDKEIRKFVGANDDQRRVSQNINRFLKYLIRKSLTSLDQLDEWSGWRKPALKAMKQKVKKFDVVLSTIPPVSTAYLGMELAAYYECNFVLDYRDPWSELIGTRKSMRELSERKRKLHRRIEDECLKASDLILTVSPSITEMLRRRVNEKVLTIPQGFSGDISGKSHDKESRYVFYAGSLAYGRDVSRVLSAIKYYVATYDEELRLVYCGPHSDLAYQQANSIGAAELIEIKGSVGENEVLEYARGSLCNLVIVSPGYEYSYPGKLFDLITAGRPIYVISSSESEAGKLVENYGIGYSIVGQSTVDLANRMKIESNREFSVPSKVNDLRVENIYNWMLDEGLNALVS